MLTRLGIIERNAREIDFGEFCFDFILVADKDDFANFILGENLRRFCRAYVSTFRKCYRFAEFAFSAHKIFNELRHIKLLKCCTLIAIVLFLVIIINK